LAVPPTKEINLFWTAAADFADEKHFLDTDLVWRHFRRYPLQHEVFLTVTETRTGLAVCGDYVDDIKPVDFFDLVRDHYAHGAGVEKLNSFRKPVVLFQMADEVNAETFIGKKQVACA